MRYRNLMVIAGLCMVALIVIPGLSAVCLELLRVVVVEAAGRISIRI